MPRILAQQIRLHPPRAQRPYRIPILELAGFEADDVIGTSPAKPRRQNIPSTSFPAKKT